MPYLFPPINSLQSPDDGTLQNLLASAPQSPANVVSGGGPLGSIQQAKAGSSAAQPTVSPLAVLGNVNAPQPAAGPDLPPMALPHINGPSPLDVIESQESKKLQADQWKDQHPWGSPDNHPGFWGKVGHIAGKIGNVAGEVLVPNIMAEIPGTDLNRFLEEKSLKGNIQGIEKQQSEQSLQDAQTQNLQSETAARDAATASKPGEDWSVVPGAQGPNGEPIEVEKGSGNMRIGTVPGGITRPPKPGEEPLGTSADQLNQVNTLRYQVLHPGEQLPAAFALKPGSTQKDAERIEKGLQGVEGAEATQEQRKQTAALRQQAAAASAQNRTDKGDATARQATYKTYQPVMDSAERVNVMTQNYEDAVKNHDQQAMLSLLANHLGMTMGLQKGARITKDTYKEAQESRPWLQGAEAKFDKDGYLTGVTLSPQQMQSMVQLAHDRYREDVNKARNEANYIAPGRTDDGPDRTPSRSTMNYYLAQANGDVNKAKQLAAEGGWSVK
jgi:hypothetical protein